MPFPPQAFLAKLPERPENGVGVDSEYGGEVARRGKAFAGFCFVGGDRTADLGCP